MAVFEVNEVFMSLEGEAAFTNYPTVYIRFSRCNFKCPKFNNSVDPQIEPSGYATLDFDPKQYTKLTDMPMISRGCDSQYAVNPLFSHTWEKWTTDRLVDEVINLLPHKAWKHPVTGLPVILSITGGEPTLRWKFIPEILNHPKMAGCTHVLVETNCAVPFKREFTMNVSQWLSQNPERQWTWSNSPKLSASGEEWAEAIRPEIASMQRELIGDATRDRVNQYFKFVVGPRDSDFAEVAAAMEEYYQGGVPRDVPIWIMPEACLEEQQQAIAQQVATMCMDKGYLFCPRAHVTLWGNVCGT
jgi:organic radical activating enzyme